MLWKNTHVLDSEASHGGLKVKWCPVHPGTMLGSFRLDPSSTLSCFQSAPQPVFSRLREDTMLTSFWFLGLCQFHPMARTTEVCWRAVLQSQVGNKRLSSLQSFKGTVCSAVSQDLCPDIVLRPAQTPGTEDPKPKAQLSVFPHTLVPSSCTASLGFRVPPSSSGTLTSLQAMPGCTPVCPVRVGTLTNQTHTRSPLVPWCRVLIQSYHIGPLKVLMVHATQHIPPLFIQQRLYTEV